MKKIIFYVITILIVIIGIISLILLIIYNHQLWLNEYNAQLEKLGYYKEDIHLLNQQIQYGLIWAGITLSIFIIIGDIVVIIIKWMDEYL